MKPSSQIFKFTDTISAVEFRPDGGLLTCGEANGKVQIFELKNKYSLRSYPEEHLNVRINAFAWSKSNLKNFVSCANDGNLHMYDIQEMSSKACLSINQAHSDNIKKVRFLENDENCLVSCSQD